MLSPEASSSIYFSGNITSDVNVDSLQLPSETLPQQPHFEWHLEDVADWNRAAGNVRRDTVLLRAELEARLDRDIQNAHINTQDEVDRRRAEIEAEVSRGPARINNYNPSGNRKYNRNQTYYVTLDGEGNIWGDFEPAKSEMDLTGKPEPAGKHMIHRNPTIPKAPRY